jgi:hypothetical protein
MPMNPISASLTGWVVDINYFLKGVTLEEFAFLTPAIKPAPNAKQVNVTMRIIVVINYLVGGLGLTTSRRAL